MKINISGLMNLISSYDKKLLKLENLLLENVFNISTIELNGNVNIIEDCKKEFEENIKEYKTLTNNLTKLKSTLYEKNNSFKLSDGRTIQTAIVENANLRKSVALYENILSYKNNKKRITEVNNSYFEVKEINYNIKEIKDEFERLTNEIQQTDFEISKLNSIEFEIDL